MRRRETAGGARVPTLIVHGGAGADPADGRDELRAGMRSAVAAGWRVLGDGGRAVDAVEAAVRALEDHPRFNAGRGAVLTATGTVELDRHGTMAAATSTGGIFGKLPGRVGDSALIGSGTYADSTLGGVSCTGDGEAIIRVALARRALDYLKEADDATYAAQVAVDLLVEEGQGQGGLILLDWRGRTGYAHSTPLMPVGLMSPALPEPRLEF